MTSETAKKKIDWTKPADQNPEITVDDFKDMVKETEKGPFLSIEQYRENRKEWRKKFLKD
ncbi:MAG: hypothetical protein RBR97_01240 [Bacteroidales bacterium]|jgi:hypothetical protein|nr:hypothetical protein [Bacteroidales bacterium]